MLPFMPRLSVCMPISYAILNCDGDDDDDDDDDDDKIVFKGEKMCHYRQIFHLKSVHLGAGQGIVVAGFTWKTFLPFLPMVTMCTLPGAYTLLNRNISCTYS